MQRGDWLLSLLYASGPKGNQVEPLDTIRIMKGLFITKQESGKPLENFYNFEPYLYGPCSFEVYDDIQNLLGSGLVEENRPCYRSYRLTQRGIVHAAGIWGGLPSGMGDLLTKTKNLILSQTFSEMLNYVYSRWPDYAERSVFTPFNGGAQ